MANLGYVQVTRQCNQQCRFCSNPPNEKQRTLEEVKQQIEDLIQRGYDGVILTGGEPTLAPYLDDAVRYAKQRSLAARIITNGQTLADPGFLARLVEAGLDHVHVSVHSCRDEVQAAITQNPSSLGNIRSSLSNLADLGLKADINTVICAQNADHLDETVGSILESFGFIRHFVFNNLDPYMNRCAENPDVVPRLADMELSLHRAMKMIDESDRTFRVERVPLCYMTEYAHLSTETRKIVKGEERVVHFLDDARGTIRQTEWFHHKAECCGACTLNPICAGLYAANTHYDEKELYPVFVDMESIRQKVIGR